MRLTCRARPVNDLAQRSPTPVQRCGCLDIAGRKADTALWRGCRSICRRRRLEPGGAPPLLGNITDSILRTKLASADDQDPPPCAKGAI